VLLPCSVARSIDRAALRASLTLKYNELIEESNLGSSPKGELFSQGANNISKSRISGDDI
jgi:hypothetical protein